MREKRKRGTFINGILWSSGGIGTLVPNVLITTYFSFYATDVLGMGAGLVAFILLVTKLLDGVTDLISGLIIDNTHTRWGKGRPFDICLVFIGLFTILLFNAPKSGIVFQAIYLGIMYSLVQAVFATLFHTADRVYLLHAFPEERERNNTFGVSTVFGQLISSTVSVIVPVFIAAVGTNHAEWGKTVALAVIPCTILSMVRFFFIKEKDNVVNTSVKNNVEDKKAEKKKNRVGFKDGVKAISANPYILLLSFAIFVIVIASGFMGTATAYYFQYIMKDMNKMAIAAASSYASLIMVVLFVPLSNKFGKDKMMKFGLLLAVLGNLIRWFGGANIVTITAGLSLVMIGIMPISIYFPLYLFDIIDYGEWKTGKRVEGLYAAFPTFANKVAGGLAVSLAMFILGAAGYNGSAATQPQSVLTAIEWIYNGIPTIIQIIMATMVLFFYNIDKKMPQIKKELEERHAKG